jgi:hypothetical protein
MKPRFIYGTLCSLNPIRSPLDSQMFIWSPLNGHMFIQLPLDDRILIQLPSLNSW